MQNVGDICTYKMHLLHLKINCNLKLTLHGTVCSSMFWNIFLTQFKHCTHLINPTQLFALGDQDMMHTHEDPGAQRVWIHDNWKVINLWLIPGQCINLI